MKNRYYVATENLVSLVSKLEKKEYLQMTDAGLELNHLIIDTEHKQFWLTDEKHYQSNINIIKSKHGLELQNLNDAEIEKL